MCVGVVRCHNDEGILQVQGLQQREIVLHHKNFSAPNTYSIPTETLTSDPSYKIQSLTLDLRASAVSKPSI